jgi:CelD/BcsL family acetyltransferase involved in cellulose biosynthesis
LTVVLSEVRDIAALAERWRALEDRADLSFFQSWTWTGCLAEERFPDPILAEAIEDGKVVGLALFNRRRGLGRSTLYLGESGIPRFDSVAIEHNGPLVARGRDDVRDAILRTAARRYDLVLSGMATPAGGFVRKSQLAPFARLDSAWFARRGANTRQQIRRSERGYAESGPILATRAETEDEAHTWLDEMAILHQATWQGRGRAGAFADPFFARFHHALIRHGMRRDEIDLCRVAAGPRLVGILYNFRFRGRVLAYQSGFAYDPAEPRLKPGLTCHRLAIEQAATSGVAIYDFLAGDTRYKRSLADDAQTMQWLLTAPCWSPGLLASRARALLSGLRDRWLD